MQNIARRPYGGQASRHARARLKGHVLFQGVIGTSLHQDKTTRRTQAGLTSAARVHNRHLMAIFQVSKGINVTKLQLMSMVGRTRTGLIGRQVSFTTRHSMGHTRVLQLIRGARQAFRLTAQLGQRKGAFTPGTGGPTILPMFLTFIMVQTGTIRRHLSTILLMVIRNNVVTIVRQRVLSFRTRATNSTLLTT